MNKNLFITEWLNKRTNNQPMIAAGVGCGLTARAAVFGGVDFLSVYSTAIYRVRGLPSALSFLPYDNANEITFSSAPEILANADNVPVLFGLGAHDPRTTPEKLVDKAASMGASGVINEPFVGIYNNQLINQLNNGKYGFSREVEMLEYAAKNGLLTLGWVFNSQEAVMMVNAGVGIIGVIVGPTDTGSGREEDTDVLKNEIDTIREVVNTVRSLTKETIVLGHGGSLNNPQTVAKVMTQTQMDGYFTGSTGETMPVEKSIADTIRQYRNMLQTES
jgi:predicted TIM-barrel enzyme